MRLLTLLLCLACVPPKPLGGAIVNAKDLDGDGFTEVDDCDDTNPQTYPSALEICDGIDNDCDSEIDEQAVDAMLGYQDSDGDGFGDPSINALLCELGDNFVENNVDCDDTNAAVYPNAEEICDGIDNDCDNDIDDNDLNVLQSSQTTYFLDGDGDGYGAPASAYRACEPRENSTLLGGDCKDNDPNIHPAAPEVCDEIDNDCDSLIDMNDPESDVRWYADQDGDGFGFVDDMQRSCQQPPGYVSSSDDCDDSNPNIHPDALEVCDGQDNDCDNDIDDNDDSLDASTTGTAHFLDGDGDGYGSPGSLAYSCQVPPDRVVLNGDCDDANSALYPSALEVCDDGIDNNCNQSLDCADSDCASDSSCVELDCTDGLDSDGDGPWDCYDPDCQGSGACGEQQQQCSDGIDNDGDGFTDCDDSQCFLNHQCAVPSCPNFELLSLMGNNVLFGDTNNAINSVDPACGSYYGTAPDYTVQWTAPANGCATFDTLGSSYDTILAVYNSCADMSDSVGYVSGGCNDQSNNTNQSRLYCNVTQGSDYFMVIDGWQSDDIGQYGFSVSMQVGVSCNCTSTCCTN
ncbi:MAG: putative metal-binding motif-containing protein [Myxococcota bacterium]|nr:putative metal-binding motif-containing protein [Myxococcota bacterium]